MEKEEFEIGELGQNFDFKGFIFRILSYWKLFLLSLIIAFGVAYYINVRKLPIYGMSNLISIKDDQNPFFTSNTSLTFNWGGTTDKVNTAIIALRSRSHNEEVVERLQYYISYEKQGEYQLVDAYGETPFKVIADTTKFQALNTAFQITFLDSVNFKISANFSSDNIQLINYTTREQESMSVKPGPFERGYALGDKIHLPFFNATVEATEIIAAPGATFFVAFQNFDGIVAQYKNINVQPESQGSSVIQLSLNGHNKSRMVDYLNASVEVLSENMLRRKNLFATKTIRFIDSSLSVKSQELKNVETELNDFRVQNSIIDITSESTQLSEKITALDLRKQNLEQQISYYNTLEDYLQSRKDYDNLPAPSVAGITEGSIGTGVGEIIQLAQQRGNYEYTFKEDAPVFADIDRRITAVKRVLLENINSSKELLGRELQTVNTSIANLEAEIQKLPQEQQDLLKIERRYNISEEIYNMFLAKRSEAELVKAANVSDVMVIDRAKDTGGGQIGPNTRLNYIMALLVGSMFPLIIVFVVVFIDNNVNSVQEVEKLSPIPILGVVGKSKSQSNLVVFDRPKSAISEAFRGIRTSLQFIYKKLGIEGTKTILITSSVSGEGKTFCSMNLATVLALSEKKTVLIGFDLRKPKIFDDFLLSNEIGISNYLIGDKSVDEIVQETRIPFLDVITAGPIPPNPSELLMHERTDELIAELREKYDYIVLDTPPVGLVADALTLVKYADASIYVVRQGYTKRGMLNVVNDKYKKGEIKNISFVLNFFEQKAKYGGYGQGYGYGYGYGNYSNGYHEEEKQPFFKRFFKFKK
ncbi:MAG TPA: polysaccharide biosynthesis tyrosine autokinase [Salinimicrobium sp.]|nr:polysaccharide biosynthesis tyrosine autokinase [Salinimicrobium sp.]